MRQFLAMVLTVLFLAINTVQADSKFFRYAAATNTWNTISNFWGAISGGPYSNLWVSNDGATFEGTAGTVNLSSNQVASSVTLSVAGYTLSGGSLTLAAPATVTNAVGGTISSVLAGSDGLFKFGAGALVLSGSNTFTGGTTISAGTVQAGSAAAFGAGAITINGGTLDVQTYSVGNPFVILSNTANTIWVNGNYRALSGQLTGPGGFTLNGVNTPGLALSNTANDFSGGITINSGAFLMLNNSEVLPDGVMVAVNGALRFETTNGVETVAGVTGGGSIWRPLNSPGTFNFQMGAGGSNSTFTGTIGAAGQNNNLMVTKLGSGTLTLSGANPYTGLTTISEGTLQIGAGSTTGSLASPAITNNATLVYSRSNTIDINTAITGTGAIIANAGAGTVGFRGLINVGSVTATSTYASSGQALYGSSYAAAINLFTNITTTGNQTYNGIVSIGRDTVNPTTILITTGGGNVTLSGGVVSGLPNYWSSANLIIDTSVGNGAVTLGGAVLSYGVGNLNINSGAGTITLTGGNYYYDYSVFNGNVILTSNVTFQNANQWVRGVTFNGSVTGNYTLTVNLGNGTSSTTGTGTGGLIFNSSSPQLVSCSITGTTALVKSGAGPLTLSGINTYAGATTINGGKLVVDGSIAAGVVTVNYGAWLGGTGTIGGPVVVSLGGGIAPGDGVGVTTVSNLSVATGSVNIFDFDGTPANDLLVVARSGGFTNNGTAFLLYTNGTANAWIPALGTPYNLIQYSGAIAGAGGFSLAGAAPGFSYTFSTNGTYVSVTFGGPSVWTGGGADNYWRTAGNWGGVAVTNNAALVFDGNIRTVTTNDFTAGTPFSIVFTNTADAFTLSGNAITLAGDVVNLSPNTQTINNAATLTTIRGVNAGGGDVTLNGILSGIGGITKAGPGTLTLAAANTYSGATSITGGKLLLTNGSALQNSALDYGNYGGILSFGTLTNVTLGGLAGSQSLALTNDAAQSVRLLAGNNNGISSYSGVMSGSGSLTKVGTGTQTLSGTNTFTGLTQVNQGALALASTNGPALAGNLTFDNNLSPDVYTFAPNQFSPGAVVSFVTDAGDHGRFELMGTTQTVAGIQTVGYASIRGVIQNQEAGPANNGTSMLVLNGSGNYTFNGYLRNSTGILGLTKNGTGTQTLRDNAITYTGATFLNAGVLNFDGGNSGSSTPITLNGGTLTHKGTGYRTMGGLLTVAVDSTIVVTNSGASNPLFFDAGIAGSGNLTITNQGAATVGVNFRNTPGSYTGALTVNGGQVGISSGAGLALANSDVTLTGAALNLTAIFGDTATDASVKSLTGNSASSSVVLGAQRLTISGGSGSFAGLIGGTGGITKSGSGTQALSGTNTYTGATVINGGTLAVNGSLAAGSAVSVATGGTLGGTGNVAGIVSLAGGGHVAPGYGVGSITNGGLNMAAGSLFDVEFDLANTQTNDQIFVTGSGGLTLNGGAFNLYSNGTTSAWTTPGTYSLIQYSGALGGSGVAGLLVNNPAPNRSYTFSALSGWVTVTVGVTTGSVWNGSSTADGKWQTATNWTGNAAPNPGDVLTFAGSTRLANTNDYAATTFGGINFSAGAGAFVLAGNPLTLSGAVNNYSAAAQTLALSVTTSAGGLTVNTISGNVTANSGVSGADGLIKSGSYTLTLSGNNAYAYGDTTIAAGTFEIGGTAQLGAGTYSGAITNSGALLVNCTTNQTLLGAISGIGAVTKSNTGTLTLAGANSYSGALTVNAGKLIVTGPNTGSSATTLNGGTIALSGGDNRLPIGSSMSFGGTSTLDVGSINQTILNVTFNNGVTATVAGSGGTLNVNGSSNIILANGPGVSTALNLNGLTASFTNAAGTIYGAYNNSSSGSGANATILVNGATLTATQIVVANGSYTGGANAPPVAGTLTVTTAMLKVDTLTLANRYWASGSATVNLNNGGTISARLIARGSDSANWGITRAINWNDGTIANYNANTDLTIESLPGSYGATMTLASTGTHAFSISSGRQGTVNQVISGSGSLIKVGSGTLTLNAVNTYTGATVVAEGVLRLGVAVNTLSTNGSVVMAGGILDARSYTNLVGTLTVGAGNSTIWMATNATATLQFRDSSAIPWSGNGTLRFGGTLQPTSVRFGTNQYGLKGQQLNQLEYGVGGRQLMLDNQGYLVPRTWTLIIVQ